MIDEQKKKPISWPEEIKSLLFIGLIALLIRTFIMEPFYVPTGSMRTTILEGDYIFGTKYDYGYSKYSFLFFTPEFMKGRILASEPKRGDIVIMRPPHDMESRYIKRLIGMPGDKIQILGGLLYINDKAIQREFIGNFTNEDGRIFKRYLETLPNGVQYNAQYLPEDMKKRYDFLDNTKAFIVPEGHYFFMGDNRNESKDSRSELGFVPSENLIAKAQFFFFSTKESLWKNTGIVEQFSRLPLWITSIRWNRFFKNIYSTE
ncbi:MAG: preprotein translocase subunit SecF [Pseudomonadota bacterium]|jgi:signal peptidase I